MPATKKRINLTVGDETFRLLKSLSEKRGESISAVGLKLIEQSLELQEDLYYATRADERLKLDEPRAPHHRVWD